MDAKAVTSALKGAEGKPVLVVWYDAHVLSLDLWLDQENIDLDTRCEVTTAGIYLGVGGDQLWVSQATLNGGGQHSCPFAIPLGCVDRVRVLR